MRIGIVVPVYLSSDLLFHFTKETVESIKSKNHDLRIYIIVNHAIPLCYPNKNHFYLHRSITEFKVLDNPKGNHVSAAWNFGIQNAFGDACDFAIVANNDLVFHPECIDNLAEFGRNHTEFTLWSAAEWLDLPTLKEASLDEVISQHPHFSCFMVDAETIEKVGYFDEKLLMSYYEDSDYHTRVLLSGNKAGKTETAKFYHYGSRTIKVDEELFDRNKRSYEDNREYVSKKWGVDFHGKVYDPPEEILKECFKNPFNDPTKTVKDW